MQHEEAPLESLATDAPAPRPRVVALLNQKGGVGKTTSTVNLGAALARFGHRVLLIDLDPQSNLSLHFGVEGSPEQRTVRDLLLDPSCGIDDVVQQARPGLDFVPAVTELALVEGELAAMDGMQGVLRGKLESARGRYDVVLLDCPPSLGVLSVNALTAADEVFVPMQAHYLPLRGLEKLLQTVHLVAQGLNPSIRVTGILLCMHDGSSSHARAVIGEMEAQFEQFRAADVPWSGACVLQPPIRRNIKLAEAPSFGKTIFDYAPACPGARDYRELARGLLERWSLSTDAFDGGPVRRARAARRAAPTSESKPTSAPRRKSTRTLKSVPKPKSRSAARPAPKPKPVPKRATKRATKPKPKPKPVAKPARAAKAPRRARTGRGRIRSGGLSL
ncbi:MAG: ParA family protein [Phycisphaerales bacterium]|nr:ParA family protein [Phycisphaerales bacterium]